MSATLEASGELSEEAIEAGHETGGKSFWGSDTAESFRYTIVPSDSEVTVVDCNGNRMPDECDIANSSSADRDENGVLDDCEFLILRGDVDGDGKVPGDTVDILAYVRHCFLGSPPPPCLAAADADGDGAVGRLHLQHRSRAVESPGRRTCCWDATRLRRPLTFTGPIASLQSPGDCKPACSANSSGFDVDNFSALVASTTKP